MQTLTNLLAHRVKSVPDYTALKYGTTELTYAVLDEQSNRLANCLLAMGVTQGSLVPVCCSRPLDMVIAIWGILKAGCAYVPADPEFPVERLSFMIGDTGANLVISDASCARFLAAAAGKQLIAADEDWAVLKEYPATECNVTVTPRDLAYVIYTSGSTGRPKGVLIEHGSVMNYLDGLFATLPYGSCRSFALGVSFAADSVITHLFGSVLAGGTLHLFDKEDYNNAHYIHQYFGTHHIDCLKAVPSHWKSQSLEGIPLLPRKILMFGGEALNTAMIRDIIPAGSRSCTILNHYGPTETTVGQLLHIIDDSLDYGYTIPIGKPFTGAVTYILDEQGNEAAEGSSGELYIGGTCVARGYLNRPELTEERFIPNKFGGDDGARLYRTGDLVRKLENGDIEFLGRIDEQVKINGYRIELGEIENTLQKAPHVNQCAVLARERSNGDKRLVGYVVSSAYDREAIMAHMQQMLPQYMIPHLLVPLDELPFFPNGKIDKRALPDPDASTLLTNRYYTPHGKTEQLIADIWKELLGVTRTGADDNFFELGGTSLQAVKFAALLRSRNNMHLPVVKLYQFPRLRDLAAFLDGKPIARKQRATVRQANADVAVIGMSGRFPGADSIGALWEVLKNGVETTTFFQDHELHASIPASLRHNPDYVKARGIVNNVKTFDAAFFGIPARQAELMDPQQRVFLEIAWEAMEAAGYIPGQYDGSIGVFAGVRFNTYFANNVSHNDELIENTGRFQVMTLNDKDYVASRTAYALDLKGPAVNVQSACSTSLVAIAQAAESIRKGQCDMALAGGASITTPINSGHLYNEGAMLSNDGHCRPFDAGAKGTVFSDGAGVVLLKSHEAAVRDGDTVFAVIKGIGLSNDGGGKGSFTAPSAEGQAAAIRMAIDDAGVDVADIGYIEAHGTATPLGDPIEIEGLNMAFGSREQKQYCAIGSVKGNFGHLTVAAGVAGFIKTCLSLYHKKLLPSINFKHPNPDIDFKDSPFFVNTVLKNWETEKRIAGISSFGVGGTNAHIILAGAENSAVVSSPANRVQLLCWSAKTKESLDEFGIKLADYLHTAGNINLADAAYTLHTGRSVFPFRRFAISSGPGDFTGRESDDAHTHLPTGYNKEKSPDIVFMFPGQGDQYPGMCKSLYEEEPVFRQAMKECAALLEKDLNENILDIIYPETMTAQLTDKLNDTAYSQPAMFCIGYALGKLWMSRGIFPSAFVGHSIGEFVAACFAGVFSLEQALLLIARRGKMMAGQPRGSMLSVRLSQEEVTPYLSAGVSLAAVNSPQLSVVAGSFEAIEDLTAVLNKKGILNKPLTTSHAFHSHMMDEIVEPFGEFVKTIVLNPPLIPIVSSVTGEWLTGDEATDPAYWARHLRATVYFGQAVQKLLDDSFTLFLELGPARSAATLARQQAAGKDVTIIASVEKDESAQPCRLSALKALGQLWLRGVTPLWPSLYEEEKRKKLNDLPTYAFNRQEYWVEAPGNIARAPQNTTANIMVIPTGTHQPTYVPGDRKARLIEQVRNILEDTSGIEMNGVTPDMTFIEMGFDSLLLTQVALTLKKEFAVPVSFRQLNEDLETLNLLTGHLDANLPAEVRTEQPQTITSAALPVAVPDAGTLAAISYQLQQLAQQVALLQGGQPPTPAHKAIPAPATITPGLTPEEEAEIKKPFGAAARIEKHSAALTGSQQEYVSAFTAAYNLRTRGSKAYTQQHRAYMADPRVVSGFRPATKDLTYSIVVKRSKGSRLWDIDGNEYIDSLNGFGSNMLGYQPDFIKKALIEQVEKGYEIGPQHELAGEVCKLICDFTGLDRAALCNTGSEAVLGAMRIARTVTGRSIIVAFAGSYHGITDEVIARGSKKLKTYPAAPGIMPEAVQNMLILDYGTDESLKIIEERAHEIAAVLVEPVQSRRCDFQPVAFLKKLRDITRSAKTVLIFDEVISGFRFHPGGVQAMFGIKADIATYGKVIGGGLSIGVVAGAREYMDALDGGWWQYGDDSIPEAGVTYFAGTFVRHPLVLATAKASLEYFRQAGPQLQEELNSKGQYIAATLNSLCRRLQVPMFIARFGSLWRIRMLEEYPYTELFFTLMRHKGIHIQEGFPCFLTTAHSDEDIQTIITRFEESLTELKAAGLIPEYRHAAPANNDINMPPVPGARLGKDRAGNPGWFVGDKNNPGKYLQVINSNHN